MAKYRQHVPQPEPIKNALRAAFGKVSVETSVDARKLGLGRRDTLQILLENPRNQVTARNGSQMVQKVFAQKRNGSDFVPGEASRLLKQLSTHERQQILAQAQEVANQRERGNHRTETDDQVARRLGANANLVPLVDALEMDDLALGLQQRRPTDESLPLPELTSRDLTRAAYIAHGGTLEEI